MLNWCTRSARRRRRRELDWREDGPGWVWRRAWTCGPRSAWRLLTAHATASDGLLPPACGTVAPDRVVGQTIGRRPDLICASAPSRIAGGFAAGADVLLADVDVVEADGLHRHPTLGTAWDPIAARVRQPPGWIIARPGLDPNPALDPARQLLAWDQAGKVIRHLPWVLGHVDTAPSHPTWHAGPAPTAGPTRVTAVIPSRDRPELLETCVRGLCAGTDWPSLEVVIVDHASTRPATATMLRTLCARYTGRVRVMRDDGEFNFSRLCNRGAALAGDGHVLLLNDDIEIGDATWLRRMAAALDLPGVGAVGARLLYPDGTIQHAGLHVGQDWTAHVHRGAPGDAAGHGGCIAGLRCWSAATGACLLVRGEDYRALGGLDEGMRITWSDVDLCLRLRHDLGQATVVTQDAVLIHHGSASRRHDPVEFAASAARAAARLPADWTDPWAHPRYARACEQLEQGVLDGTPPSSPTWR
jgi:GT2 family glycosyltransferase